MGGIRCSETFVGSAGFELSDKPCVEGLPEKPDLALFEGRAGSNLPPTSRNTRFVTVPSDLGGGRESRRPLDDAGGRGYGTRTSSECAIDVRSK